MFMFLAATTAVAKAAATTATWWLLAGSPPRCTLMQAPPRAVLTFMRVFNDCAIQEDKAVAVIVCAGGVRLPFLTGAEACDVARIQAMTPPATPSTTLESTTSTTSTTSSTSTSTSTLPESTTTTTSSTSTSTILSP